MRKLAGKEYCTGCTACAAICPKGCIAMAADENGFLCPVVDPEKCVSCGLCTKVCPVVTPLPKNECAPRACAAYSTDEQMRLQSSSGGVFTEIARAVLAKGGVVYGAAYNENFEVVHVCAKDEAGLAGLPVASKHDSQDICFIPDGDYLSFLIRDGVLPQPGHFPIHFPVS